MSEIAAINAEQLVTATDRLLFSGLPAKRRPSASRLELALASDELPTQLVRPVPIAHFARLAALGCAVGVTVGTLCAAMAAL
jgi:hypothetical protein